MSSLYIAVYILQTNKQKQTHEETLKQWSLFGGLHGVILTHLLQSGNSMKVFHLDTLSPWVLFGEHALTDGISDGEIHPLGVSKKS